MQPLTVLILVAALLVPVANAGCDRGTCGQGPFSSCASGTSCGCNSNPGYYEGPSGCRSIACPRGKYSSGGSATSCPQCTPGKYSTGGEKECTYCAAGKYLATNGGSACLPCGKGKYSKGAGATSCESCPVGQYTDDTSKSACTACPEKFLTAGTGSTSSSTCNVENPLYCPKPTSCANPSGSNYKPAGHQFAGSGYDITKLGLSSAFKTGAAIKVVQASGTTPGAASKTRCTAYYNKPATLTGATMKLSSSSTVSASTTEVSSYEDLVKQTASSLDISVNVAVPKKGSASVGYSNKNINKYESSFKAGSTLFVTSAKLSLYDIGVNTAVPVSAGFKTAVLALPAAYSNVVYQNFVQTWGTHMVSQVTMGGLFTGVTQTSYSSCSVLSSSEISTCIDASIKAKGAPPLSSTMPALINFGGAPPRSKLPLSICQGDCDKDSDCKSGLTCFQRHLKSSVPGCASGGSGDLKDHDYCYSKTKKQAAAQKKKQRATLGVSFSQCDASNAKAQCGTQTQSFSSTWSFTPAFALGAGDIFCYTYWANTVRTAPGPVGLALLGLDAMAATIDATRAGHLETAIAAYLDKFTTTKATTTAALAQCGCRVLSPGSIILPHTAVYTTAVLFGLWASMLLSA